MASSDPDATTSAFKNLGALDGQTAFFVRYLDVMHALPAIQANHRRVRELLAPSAGDRILDVGSGAGSIVLELAPLVGAGGEAMGVDRSEGMLAVARQRAEGMGLPAAFRAADAMDLPFPDDAFAACRTERVLQYLQAPTQDLTEMVRVTKPGGRIVASEMDWDTVITDLPDIGRTTTLRAREAVIGTIGEGRMGRQWRRLFLDAGLDQVTYESVAVIVTDAKA